MTREDKLIKQIKQGNTDALEELIKLYYPEILKYCLWRAPNHASAEDAVQETFLKAIRYMDAYVHKGRFKAFLYKIAANTCIDMARMRWNKDMSAEVLEDRLSYTEAGFEESEENIQLKQLIRNLKTEHQEIIVLRFRQNLTLREISEVTGIPLRTVQSRLRTALNLIKDELVKGGYKLQ